MRYLASGIIRIAFIALAGCKPSYDDAIRHCREEIEEVAEFSELFPEATHLITHYTGNAGLPIWTSTAVLHGRYVVTLTVKLKRGESGKLLRAAEPEYLVREVRRFQLDAQNRVVEAHFGLFETLNADRWKSLLDSKMDWSAIGIAIESDNPVQGVLEHANEF